MMSRPPFKGSDGGCLESGNTASADEGEVSEAETEERVLELVIVVIIGRRG